jgi:hypothetical protein
LPARVAMLNELNLMQETLRSLREQRLARR